MPIVAIVGEKGGTGKTTIATNLAAVLAQGKRDVLLVDTDTQRSASYWTATRAEREELPRVACVQLYEPTLGTQLADIAKRYTDVIVDAGGRDSPELRRTLLLANIAYIPIQPAQFDVWTVSNLNDHIKQAKVYNPSLCARVVLSRAPTHPNSREIEEVKEALADYEHLPISPCLIRDRAIFRRAAREGMSVVEMSPSDAKANEEVTSLFREIYKG